MEAVSDLLAARSALHPPTRLSGQVRLRKVEWPGLQQEELLGGKRGVGGPLRFERLDPRERGRRDGAEPRSGGDADGTASGEVVEARSQLPLVVDTEGATAGTAARDGDEGVERAAARFGDEDEPLVGVRQGDTERSAAFEGEPGTEDDARASVTAVERTGNPDRAGGGQVRGQKPAKVPNQGFQLRGC